MHFHAMPSYWYNICCSSDWATAYSCLAFAIWAGFSLFNVDSPRTTNFRGTFNEHKDWCYSQSWKVLVWSLMLRTIPKMDGHASFHLLNYLIPFQWWSILDIFVQVYSVIDAKFVPRLPIFFLPLSVCSLHELISGSLLKWVD